MRGQNILRELNDLARAIGAPVDGTNISEQVAKIKLKMGDLTSYNALTDKPKIEGHELAGNKTWEDLGISNPMHIAGSVATVADLANIQNPQAGDVYLVGPSDGIKDEYVYTSAGSWEFIGDRVVVVDDALSTTSDNPVQNKVLAVLLNHFTFSANSKQYYLQPEQPSNPQDGDIWIG